MSRRFVLNFLISFFFCVGVFSLLPTFPLYLADLSFNDSEIGILIGAFALAAVLMRPVCGVALQKYSHRIVIAWGCVIFSVTIITLFFVTAFLPIFLIRILQGAAFALVTTSNLALVVDTSAPARRAQMLSYFLLSANMAMVVAPAFGMSLINLFSFDTLFYAVAVASVIALATSMLLNTEVPSGAEKPVAAPDTWICMAAIPSSIVILLHTFGWGAISAFFPLYAVQKGVANPGLFFGATAMAMITSRLLGSRLMSRHRERWLTMTLIAGTATGAVLIACSESIVPFIVAGLILGCASAFVVPTLMDVAVRDAGPSSNAAVATFMGFSDLGMALGPVVMGLLATRITYSTMFLCVAFTAMLNVIYSSAVLRKP